MKHNLENPNCEPFTYMTNSLICMLQTVPYNPCPTWNEHEDDMHIYMHVKLRKFRISKFFKNLKFKMILVRYLYRSDTFVTCHICNTDYTVLHVLKKVHSFERG